MKKSANRIIAQMLLVLAIMAPGVRASAGNLAECASCASVTDQELSVMRGGYVAGDGLEVLIGIKDYVLFNGALQVVNTLNLPPLGSGMGQAPPDQVLDRMVTVHKFGDGNSIAPAVLDSLQSGRFTFIQNSLDHAVIRKVTEINASVTVLGLYREMNMRSLMNQQLVNAAR